MGLSGLSLVFNLPYVYTLSNSGKKLVTENKFFVEQSMYMFFHTLFGIFEDAMTIENDLLRMLQVTRRISTLGAHVGEVDSPNLKADIVLGLNLIYIGMDTLATSFQVAKMVNDAALESIPSVTALNSIPHLNSLKIVSLATLGFYSLYQGVKRAIKWLPVNSIEYSKTHKTTKKIVEILKYPNGKKVFSDIDSFLSHPAIVRELDEFVNYHQNSTKKTIDLALKSIKKKLISNTYLAIFPSIKPLSDRGFVIFAKGASALDPHQAFSNKNEEFLTMPTRITSEITRNENEICEFMTKVHQESGNLIEGLIIEGHGSSPPGGIHLGANFILNSTHLDPLVNCIQKTMKLGAPIILNGCSTSLLAKALSQKSGHPVYGSLRDTGSDDGLVFFQDSDGLLGIKGTDKEDKLYKKIPPSKVYKKF